MAEKISPKDESMFLTALGQVANGSCRRVDLELNLFGQKLRLSIFRMAGFFRADFHPVKEEKADGINQGSKKG